MYLNTITGEYPVDEQTIRASFGPNVSFPTPFVPPADYVYVMPSNPPAFDDTMQYVVEDRPAFDGAIWNQVWELKDYPPEEAAARAQAKYDRKAAEVRSIRNQKLAACDWTQVADAPVDKAAWAAYRQSLRDISTQTGFPWEVTWPTEP